MPKTRHSKDNPDFDPDLQEAVDAATHFEEIITEPRPDAPRDSDDPSTDLAVLELPGEQPWDRLPDEPPVAHKYFLTFRDLGLSRTYTEVGRVHDVRQPVISKMAKAYDWQRRVSAWDNAEERLYQLRRFEALRQMADDHVDQIHRAIEAISAPFEAIQHRMGEDPEFIETLAQRSPEALLNLAGASARTLPNLLAAERLARDLPTEIVGGMVQHQHTVEIRQADLGEVLATLVNANALPGLASPGGEGEAGEIVDAEMVEFHPVSGSERADQPGDESAGGGDR